MALVAVSPSRSHKSLFDEAAELFDLGKIKEAEEAAKRERLKAGFLDMLRELRRKG